MSDWPYRVKYVDDASVYEVIPRCSPGYLPHVASDICHIASERGMRLNPKKCRELIINFLQFQPAPVSELQLMGSAIKRVNSYKILGVHVSDDLTGNTHIDYLFKKANKCLFALRILKKSGVAVDDLVKIFCALIRSVLEYASPVWAALLEYLDNVIESVQRKALTSKLSDLSYAEALHRTSSQSLSERRAEACCNFRLQSQHKEPVLHRDTIQHDYSLRSGHSRSLTTKLNTKSCSEFVKIKFRLGFSEQWSWKAVRSSEYTLKLVVKKKL